MKPGPRELSAPASRRTRVRGQHARPNNRLTSQVGFPRVSPSRPASSERLRSVCGRQRPIGAVTGTDTMNLMPALSAFSVFLAITAAGFIFLMVSAAFGEVFEHFDAFGDHDGPGFFSTRVLAVFVTAFGAAGAVATYYGLGPVPASLVGLATGFVFGGAIGTLGRILYRQQASSDVRSHDLVGQVARVIVAIPAGGVGQVRCRIGEELVDKIARTRNGEPVIENASVQVEEVLGETVIVKRQ